MKRKLGKVIYIALIPLILITLLFFPTFKSEAATLSAVYIMTSRMQTNLSSGVKYFVAFETTATFTPETDGIILEFPEDLDDDWCTAAGTDLVVTGVTSTPPDSTGDYDVDSALPGASLTGECIQGGASTADRIVIDGAGALTSGTTYGFTIEEGGTPTATLGTPNSTGSHIVTLTAKNESTSNIHTKSFGIYLVSDDNVEVTATVLEVPTITCAIGTTSVSLGNLYQGGSYVTGSHNITTSTSDTASGYYWCAYGEGDGSTDAGLHSASDDIFSTGSTTIDLSVAGSEGFGMVVSAPDPDTSSTVTIPADFDDGTAGTFGALDRGVAGAQLIIYQIGNQSSSEAATITYGARAGAGTAAGSYSETVTYICGGYY